MTRRRSTAIDPRDLGIAVAAAVSLVVAIGFDTYTLPRWPASWPYAIAPLLLATRFSARWVTAASIVGLVAYVASNALTNDDQLMVAFYGCGLVLLQYLAAVLAHRRAEAARLHRQAETAVHARDAFVAVAAHELRSPLAVVLGKLWVARCALEELHGAAGSAAAPAERALAAAEGHADRLAQLVHRLLDTSRLDAGQFTLHPADADLSVLVREAVDATRRFAERHTLVVNAPETLPARTDPVRMEQVLRNLLENAIKYSPAGGLVEVDVAQPDPETARLSVRDYGPGLTADDAQHVFERYYRAPNTNGTNGRAADGLGLGLYVCHELVRRLGGRITVESPPGGGTRMVVCVPLGLACAGQSPPARMSAEAAPGSPSDTRQPVPAAMRVT